MQAKLKDMMLILRPTEKGSGRIPIRELDSVLRLLGFDFLITGDQLSQMKQMLDKDNQGIFQEDELIAHLTKNYAMQYSNANALRDAFKLFDFDSDGKIKTEEFEYFMRNFGVADNSTHMSEERLKALFDACKDAQGYVVIENAVKALVRDWPQK